MKTDVIIIGAGPAGVSLATYLKRFNIDCLVFNNHKSNLAKAHLIENYYGFKQIAGQDLFERGLEKLNDLEIPYIEEEVISIDYYDSYLIKTKKNEYNAKILVLATGLAKKSLNLKNLARLEGKGISYCATCDGFFFRKKKLGIIGSGEFMEEELAVLEQITPDITIFSNGISYQNDKHQVITDKILDVFGEDKLAGVETVNAKYPLDGLFIAEGTFGSFAIVKHLGILTNEKGEVVVDNNYQTNIPLCFAVGDIIPNIKQIGVAVADGIKLGYYLFDLKKRGEF